MNQRRSQPYRNVTLRDEALEDLREIAQRSRDIAIEVLRLLKLLDAGSLTPVRLNDHAKTGDLTDCGKIVVAVSGHPEHRIVVRDLGKGRFEVSEVIVIDARAEDLAYLLAGLRLGRIVDPVRRSDTSRRVDRIRRAARPSGPSDERRD
ncbi:MAG: hypothetical protein EBX39_14375 [Actinobacteria bacterium]|nr:hypothetical protein [Actinomycetota bacterium]